MEMVESTQRRLEGDVREEMRSKLAERIEIVAFVVGLAILAFLYGFAARHFELFPSVQLQRAWMQAQRVTSDPPGFTSPRVYDRAGARRVDTEAARGGLTLVTSSWKDTTWRPGARLIDEKGRILHEWRLAPERIFTDSLSRRPLGFGQMDIQGSYLFPDGDLLVNVEYGGTVRMDACGEIEWTLAAGGHHSIERADDGTFWIPGVSATTRGGTPMHPDSVPGVPGDVYLDWMLRVSPDGEVLDSLNVLDVIYANGLERHLFRSGDLSQRDITHLNDIQPLPDSLADEYPLFEAGDLAISLWNPSLVLVVDPETGQAKWHSTQPFIHQHDPDFIGDGWIGVFDNVWDGTERGTTLGGSRIIAVQPHTDSVRTLFPTERSEPFYTEVRGKWQKLDNGNLLLTEAEAGRVVEVTPDGRTVWDWVVEPYSESRVPYVARGARLDVTREQVAGWPCSSEPTPASEWEIVAPSPKPETG